MNFAKLHGAGNDFILFDGREGITREQLTPLLPIICHRRLGVGADGVLLLLPTGEQRARVVYWNSDGSPASFCGNGTRCAARFVFERWGWREMVLETGFAAVPAVVEGNSVTLQLPAPAEVWPEKVYLVHGAAIRARYVMLGVPHLVVRVGWPDFWRHPLEPLAPLLRRHPQLPAGGANVNFAREAGDGSVEARFFERGVEGETLASGSGVVAVALVATAEGWASPPVRVATASGRELVVEVEGTPPMCPVRLHGPAEWVAEGTIADELLASPLDAVEGRSFIEQSR